MASILVISLCTEPPVGSGFLLGCAYARRGEAERGWLEEKRVLVGRRKARGKKRKEKAKASGCCATLRASFLPYSWTWLE